jgi:hypothetical protein
MNGQLVTPLSASTPVLVIPSSVSPLGPQLSRLPDELLLKIFEVVATSMFPANSRFNTVIDPKTFNILNRHYSINRIRNVSRDFTLFFMQAFYENFAFSFKHSCLYNLMSDYLTSFPAPLPRHHLRHHFRSIRIEIVLENYYFTPQSDFTVPRTCRTGRNSRKITSGDEILAFCPAARQLHSLTNPWTGFSNLALLDLHIRTDFCLFPVDDNFLRALEEANFVVTAGKVLLTVTDKAGDIKPEHLEVKKRIVVK